MPRTSKRIEGKEAVEARIHQRLKDFGVSGPGREWLLRALHPASEKKSPGLPDASATPVLRPDFRISATITAPPLPEGVGAWDCFIWIPPGDVNALYWASGPSGTDFSAAGAPPGNTRMGVIQLQTSELLQEGNIFLSKVGPTDQASLTEVPKSAPLGFRHQFKSVTINQIASAVSDQGQVYAAQFAPLIRRQDDVILGGEDTGVPIPDSDPPANYTFVAGQYNCVIPTNEVDLSAMAPTFYSAPSREGVYMPLRLAGPSQPFARTVPGSAIHVAFQGAGVYGQDVSCNAIGAVLLPTTGTAVIPPVGSAPYVPWPFAALVTSAYSPYSVRTQMDSGYDNTNIGVVIFRGLQGSGGGGFGAALQVKMIAGLEIAPTPTASDRVFVEPPAPYEPKALEAYYSLGVELDDAYPARYNSFDDILNAIGSVASKVWGAVEPALVGAVQQGAQMLTGAGMQMLGRRLRAPMMLAPPASAPTAAQTPRVTYRAPSVARSTGSVKRKPNPRKR